MFHININRALGKSLQRVIVVVFSVFLREARWFHKMSCPVDIYIYIYLTLLDYSQIGLLYGLKCEHLNDVPVVKNLLWWLIIV